MSIVKGIIVAVVALIIVIALVAGALIGAGVMGWKAAQRAGNEAATIQDMKTIEAVEVQYYNTHNRTFGTLDQMIESKMLSQRFSGNVPIVDGYAFTLIVSPRTTSKPSSYTVTADPQNETAGKNHFYLDSIDSTIRVNSDRRASASDPPLGG